MILEQSKCKIDFVALLNCTFFPILLSQSIELSSFAPKIIAAFLALRGNRKKSSLTFCYHLPKVERATTDILRLTTFAFVKLEER